MIGVARRDRNRRPDSDGRSIERSASRGARPPHPPLPARRSPCLVFRSRTGRRPHRRRPPAPARRRPSSSGSGSTRPMPPTAADALVQADLMGVDSHGVSNYIQLLYVPGLRAGSIEPRPHDRGGARDADLGADRRRRRARPGGRDPRDAASPIEKARATGVGLVAVRNSRHYGAAGVYARMALAHDMIGLSLTNSDKLVVPTFGRESRIGTNPIGVAVPAGERASVPARHGDQHGAARQDHAGAPQRAHAARWGGRPTRTACRPPIPRPRSARCGCCRWRHAGAGEPQGLRTRRRGRHPRRRAERSRRRGGAGSGRPGRALLRRAARRRAAPGRSVQGRHGRVPASAAQDARRRPGTIACSTPA